MARLPERQIVQIEKLNPAAYNPRKDLKPGDAEYDHLADSMEAFGYIEPIVWNKRTGNVVGGHQRLKVLIEHGETEVEVVVVDYDDMTEKAANLALNKIHGDWEFEKLADLLTDLDTGAFDLELTGFSEGELKNIMGWTPGLDGESGDSAGAESRGSLADRFIVPPFSVLDARQGYWQDRKRAWIALGIQSELGRGGGITPGDSAEVTEAGLNYYRNRNAAPGGSLRPATSLGEDGKTRRGDGKGRTLGAIPPNERDILSRSGSYDKNGLLGFSEQARSHYKGKGLARSSGQDLMKGEGNLTWVKGNRDPSTLDETSGKNLAGGRKHAHTTATAAVMELAGGESPSHQSGTSIFDPVLCELVYRWFCPPGGSVLDPFAGGSVRGIVASRVGLQYTGIDLSERQIEANREQAEAICTECPPTWTVGDSRNVSTLAPGEYDLVFSCPPYADLEVYSDDPADLSTLDYPAFIAAYREIIAASVAMLKENRFACFVVGDVRDKRGCYHNFVSDTISAFRDAGLSLYNEAILVTAVGSLSIRVGKQFQSGRKLGKTHQNVLVFYKGDPKHIKEHFGEVQCADVSEEDVAPESEP